jgi:sensor histidine kinase regulating citrate/malate metabolism
MNILFYYLFIKTGKEFEIITENELLKQNINLQRNHSFETKKLYQEIQTMRHDMKNHLIGIKSFLEDDNLNKGLTYINGIIQDIEKTKKLVFTKNDMFNAIVNNKFTEANAKEIKTSYFINYEIDQKIEDNDISILFGNLLSNAIEACEKAVGEKEVSLMVDKKRDYIFIEVKNTIEKSVLTDNPDLITTKMDKIHHGLGVKSIKNVVQKYEGIINYTEQGNVFVSSVLLLENSTKSSKMYPNSTKRPQLVD